MKTKKPPGIDPVKLKQLQQKNPFGSLLEIIPIEEKLIGHGKIARAGDEWMEKQEAAIKARIEMEEAKGKIFAIIDEIYPQWKNNQKSYDHVPKKQLKIFSGKLKRDN